MNTCAPCIINCAILAFGAVSGTKITVEIPTDAASPANDDAAFPVDAQVMTVLPSSLALTIANALARSFKEAVGLRPSSLMKSRDGNAAHGS